MNAFFDTFPTRFGLFSVAVNDSGAVIATAFGDRNALARRLGSCHLMNDINRVAAAREQAARPAVLSCRDARPVFVAARAMQRKRRDDACSPIE